MVPEKRLTELRAGARCSIVSVPHGRLLDLGLVPGTKLLIVRFAPFSGPVEIEARGSRLAIGRDLAEKIEVFEKLPFGYSIPHQNPLEGFDSHTRGGYSKPSILVRVEGAN